MNLLWILGAHFAFLSLIAVGGASATLPEMHRVLVDQLHLIRGDEFAQLFALSQAAPGPNVLFVGLFGWQIAGWAGALVSLIAMCGPACLLSVAVEHYGARHQEAIWYVRIRRALAPISIGLLVSTAVLLVWGAERPFSVLLTVVTLFVVIRFRFNPIGLIALGALAGACGLV